MTTTPTTTTDGQNSRAEALHASIVEQVEALRRSERWQQFLRFTASFHQYSLNNVLLILTQRPDATAVAGYRAWQAKGRQVRAGEHGIHIFGYRIAKTTDPDETDDTKPSETAQRMRNGAARYPILTVFDISQTDPTEDTGEPPLLARQLTGTDDFGIVNHLTTHLTSERWTVERRPLSGELHGYSDAARRQVVLNAALSAQQAAKTLIHETAHILLGHTENLADYSHHRGLAETEAESVAYVVAGLTGFDTSDYSIGYIAGWANADSTLIASTATRVLRTVHTITGILGLEPVE
ncbi:ImmA/IrrE family metallo-endopeptidase [Diaminobutyricibacter tongyongensis]|uniref:ImmA/IrrE family metallo-endopeptidase n=2 Tax=Leifsonia tongyongensis TaxID=1268043 RepID=A0A6L9Y230_9MICO|nr:ImmA/IrrE family metallo-endopeptidase [Diaminobutyricibacter tongyongensis]